MKRFFKWAAIILGALILFLILAVGLFIGWLRWSGEREWKQAEAELRAKGEKLTIAELVPPTPPDSENFFADPLWAEYADLVLKKNEKGIDEWGPRLASEQFQLNKWQSVPLTPEEKDRLSKLKLNGFGIKTRMEAFSLLRSALQQEKDPQKQKETAALYLNVMTPAEPVLTRIAKLSERPRAQFPIRYDLGLQAPLSQITATLSLSQIISRKAFSELILENNSDAANDTLTLLRLTTLEKNSPLLISFLVRAATVALALQPINEGILRHAWTEADLVSFQGLLRDLNLQDDSLLALKGERTFYNQVDPSFVGAEFANIPADAHFLKRIEAKLVQFYFRGIFLKDKAYHNLWLQRNAESLNSQIGKGWNTASAASSDKEVQNLKNHPIKRWFYMLNVISLPAIWGCTQNAAATQAQVDQSLIACALERYRIAHGSYPASLDALVPEYLAKLPNSPITGKPMNYSLNPVGTFLLWTPGWNLKSLGGKPGKFKGDGDIVWGQALPTKSKP